MRGKSQGAANGRIIRVAAMSMIPETQRGNVSLLVGAVGFLLVIGIVIGAIITAAMQVLE